MKIDQISVFLENRAGRLAEVLQALSLENINILALSLADTSDFGILRLIVRDQERASNILKDQGFTIGRTSVVAVKVPDAPGGLAQVVKLISPHNINIEYMYALARRVDGMAVMIFRFDRVEDAVLLLQDHGFNMLSSQNLSALVDEQAE